MKNIMKILAVMLCAALIFVFTGCDNNKESETPNTLNKPNVSETEKAPVSDANGETETDVTPAEDEKTPDDDEQSGDTETGDGFVLPEDGKITFGGKDKEEDKEDKEPAATAPDSTEDGDNSGEAVEPEKQDEPEVTPVIDPEPTETDGAQDDVTEPNDEPTVPDEQDNEEETPDDEPTVPNENTDGQDEDTSDTAEQENPLAGWQPTTPTEPVTPTEPTTPTQPTEPDTSSDTGSDSPDEDTSWSGISWN